MSKLRAKIFCTISGSFLRSSPWFTKTQVSCLPIALWISAATTEESTPPERPSTTFWSPTCFRMSAIASSMKRSMVQLPVQPHRVRQNSTASSTLPATPPQRSSVGSFRASNFARASGRAGTPASAHRISPTGASCITRSAGTVYGMTIV